MEIIKSIFALFIFGFVIYLIFAHYLNADNALIEGYPDSEYTRGYGFNTDFLELIVNSANPYEIHLWANDKKAFFNHIRERWGNFEDNEEKKKCLLDIMMREQYGLNKEDKRCSI